MSKYRTAQGKIVDMAALAAKNERTRAVGNMNVNARGDTIDSHGKVIKPATEKINEYYNNTVGNKTAQVKKTVTPTTRVVPDPVDLETLKEFDSNEDKEIEQIKKKEAKK